MDTSILKHCTGFDWDEANRHKNWNKHQVSLLECEQVFFNKPLIVTDDHKHSSQERRF